jgi:stage II sporulation protein M
MDMRTTLLASLQKTKNYILASLLLFVCGMWIGWESEQFRDFLYRQVQGLGEVAQTLSSMDNPQLWFFVFIFFNNAIKSIIVIFSGVFIGIFPIFFLLINGMVLGFVLAETESYLSSAELFVKGILPHGIIELPVIIIAAAYGIRFGAVVLGKLFRRRREHSEEKSVRAFLQETWPLSLFIVAALFVAALIEATITPWLLQL